MQIDGDRCTSCFGGLLVPAFWRPVRGAGCPVSTEGERSEGQKQERGRAARSSMPAPHQRPTRMRMGKRDTVGDPPQATKQPASAVALTTGAAARRIKRRRRRSKEGSHRP